MTPPTTAAGIGPVEARKGSGVIGIEEIQRSCDSVQAWVEKHDYKGWEPFDGLSSWARPLVFGDQLGERILLQAIRQSPINLRPLMGVTRKESTKGRGYMAWGYLLLYRATRQQDYLNKAVACLEWLDKNKASRFKHHSWSNHFDFTSRWGSYSKHDPIIVWTSLIGQAYIEAFEVTGEERFLRIADSACKWVMELPREKTSRGNCISYLPHAEAYVHNANMLGACLLARTAKHNGKEEYLRVARSAMEYTCSRQLSDGSWLYAEDSKYHWVDNFHTGYNLDSLYFYLNSTGDREFEQNLEHGLAFYKANFFEESGRPKYYNTRVYPVDIQCAAQSIDTLTLLSERDPSCFEIAERVAAWTIRNMQSRKGFFYYRQYPAMMARTPMLHWGQGTMFKALSMLLLHRKGEAKTQR